MKRALVFAVGCAAAYRSRNALRIPAEHLSLPETCPARNRCAWSTDGRRITRMIDVFRSLLRTLRSTVRTHRALALENLALRHQLTVLKRMTRGRTPLTPADRLLWVWLACAWWEWRQALILVKPETVMRWHRQGFRTYWTWKSRRQVPGRPLIDPAFRALIRKISLANPLWGVPRIHSELLKLGIRISPTTIAKYRIRHRRPPSPTWRAFLRNHVRDLVAVDFFTVPTATFQVLFVCVVLAHDRRRVVHLNVTANPTAEWTAQQIVEAFPEDTVPRYLFRDRDCIYGAFFRRHVHGLGISEVLTAARSPWQNPYAERVIGSIRRECLDHVIVLNERHLRRVLRKHLAYYHRSRCHLALGRDAPDGRAVQGPERGKVIAFPEVGGLHHRYERWAA